MLLYPSFSPQKHSEFFIAQNETIVFFFKKNNGKGEPYRNKSSYINQYMSRSSLLSAHTN